MNELRRCPSCNRPTFLRNKFCAWCGSKIPSSSEFDQAMIEVELEEVVGMPFLSLNNEKCTQGSHEKEASLLKSTYYREMELFDKGERRTLPSKQFYCHQCGKRVIQDY